MFSDLEKNILHKVKDESNFITLRTEFNFVENRYNLFKL